LSQLSKPGGAACACPTQRSLRSRRNHNWSPFPQCPA
jgi:hypothetical protein